MIQKDVHRHKPPVFSSQPLNEVFEPGIDRPVTKKPTGKMSIHDTGASLAFKPVLVLLRDHKKRLGAHADDFWKVTVYRCRRLQLRHWREIAAVKATEFRRAVMKARYTVRSRAGLLIKGDLMVHGWRKAKAYQGGNDFPVANETIPKNLPKATDTIGDSTAQSSNSKDCLQSDDTV